VFRRCIGDGQRRPLIVLACGEGATLVARLWRVEMLGGLRLRGADGAVTRFRSRNTACLLAYLAYHLGEAHPRERLAAALWPRASPAAGSRGLRCAIASLRHLLELGDVPSEAGLRVDSSSLQLCPHAVTTDIVEFRQSLREARDATSEGVRLEWLSRAADLYAGPLLSGCHEEWIAPERERLAQEYLQAVLGLAATVERAGDMELALGWARRAVAAEPLREEAQRGLMRLLIIADQPEAALEHYQEFGRALQEQLGVRPSASLRRLGKRLLDAQGQAPKRRPRGVRLGPPRPPRPSRGLPTGTVTFLLTDIAGSTRLREAHGRLYDQALALHHTRLRKAFGQHCGYEVKEEGDGFIVAFERAPDALSCAVASQRSLAAPGWPKGIDCPRVRMALHAGSIELVAGEYRGLTLHYASRILAAGHGGQILCSESAASLLRRDVEPGIQLVDLGTYRLRDVNVLERLFQVSYPGMEPASFPALRAEANYGSRLPPTFTRFFGRDRDLAWLRERLLGDETRLVTMTGPGGTGKTRLALEVARRLEEPFHGAVWFVPLQGLTEAKLVPGAVADALNLARSPYLAPLDQVAAALARHTCLLVLDGYEHLVDEGAAIVRALLEHAPPSKCLVTSQRTLGLTGEVEFHVPPLRVPLGPHHVESLTECESVRLFTDRAQAVRPDFRVTPANAQVVGELCEQLEGIPLAIELAAARAQVMTPAQILGQLGHRLDFLVSRKRDTPDRHRTLRAAFDWSYDALGTELQRFFRQLSVFRGGWTVGAAEAVCAESEALEYLERLRESSLVLLKEGPDEAGEVRCGFLETLREYAEEHLVGAEGVAARRRHAEYHLALAEQAQDHYRGRHEKEWMDRLEAEHDNLRVALAWFGCAPAGEEEGELRLASALGEFWVVRGHLAEGRARLGEALGRSSAGQPSGARADALCQAALFAETQADYATVSALAEESLHASREAANQRGVARALLRLGSAALFDGDRARAKTVLGQAVSIARALGDRCAAAEGLCGLGDTAVAEGQVAAARTHFEEALGLCREVGWMYGAARSLLSLGAVALDQGEYPAARALLEETLTVLRRLGGTRFLAPCLLSLGGVAVCEGDTVSARVLLAEGVAIYRELGARMHLPSSLQWLAVVARAQGETAEAQVLLEESLVGYREQGNRRGMASAMGDLGLLAAEQGDAAAAGPLLEEALSISREVGADALIAENLVGLSTLARRAGEVAAAQGLAEEALGIARRLGRRPDVARCARVLGLAAEEAGDYAAADGLLAESLAAVAGLRARWDVAQGLEALAGLRRLQETVEAAARLFGAAESLREAIGCPQPPCDRDQYEGHLSALRAALGPEDLAAAWSEGRAMAWEEAADYGLRSGRHSQSPASVVPPDDQHGQCCPGATHDLGGYRAEGGGSRATAHGPTVR
jgi:predicted ATPase/DNA-binding SARP family transcriptional activator